TLSRQRAAAVLAAMAEAGIDTAAMTAAGYGETRPVDTNETAAGRDANRRIEFRLLSPAFIGLEEPAPASIVSGVPTGETAADAAAQPAPGAIRGTQRLTRFGPVMVAPDAGTTGMLEMRGAADEPPSGGNFGSGAQPGANGAGAPGALVGAPGRPAAAGGGS